VAELAALEMLCMGNYTVGSNPTLSATYERQKAKVRRQKAKCFFVMRAFKQAFLK
jgi:hypothetical protein